MFCKHNWVFLEEVSAPSKIEILQKSSLGKLSHVNFSDSLLYKESIKVFTCSKCGKFKTVKASNQEMLLDWDDC